MRVAATLISILISSMVYGQHPQNSKTDVQLRGISAVSSKVAWASGAKGTVLRTLDGGQNWETLVIADADALDFRDIQAFDQNTAFVLSIGPGDQSRIYKTSDGGKIWQRQFTNSDPKAFYDCFAFWDSTHGIAVSDSVDGKFPLIATSDGMTWNPVLPKNMPAALPNEGAFAASGTCIATFGKNDVWFGTGGPAARVFHSSDRGKELDGCGDADHSRRGLPRCFLSGLLDGERWSGRWRRLQGTGKKRKGRCGNTRWRQNVDSGIDAAAGLSLGGRGGCFPYFGGSWNQWSRCVSRWRQYLVSNVH